MIGRPVLAALMVFTAAAPAFGQARSGGSTSTFVEPHGADLNQGKGAAELFKSDCSVCHKTAQGLAKDSGLGLQSFLRQHYTTGTSNAAAMASYLASVGRGSGGGAAAAKPASPERPERGGPAQQPSTPATAARRPAGSEPAANDGLITSPERKPAEQAVRPPEPVAEPKPVETATPSPAAEPEAAPENRRRASKPEEPAKPEAKPRRAPRVQEAAKPAPAEPARPTSEAATRPPEPAPAAPPPVEAKPAAPAAPQIPL